MSYQDLENELRQIKHESMFAQVVRENPKEGIKMIRDQINDQNRVRVVSIIGERLVTVIEAIKPAI
jgi:hypothetical protein